MYKTPSYSGYAVARRCSKTSSPMLWVSFCSWQMRDGLRFPRLFKPCLKLVKCGGGLQVESRINFRHPPRKFDSSAHLWSTLPVAAALELDFF